MEAEYIKCKVWKTKKNVRKAVNKYTDNLEQSNPDQYIKWRDYHREYSKLYYKKLRESHIMLEKMNGTHDFIF